MRKDFFLENDSRGLSVLSVDASRKVVAEARRNQGLAGDPHGGLLLELYGDDAMLVRVVADEPLTAEEDAEWLGRIRVFLDAPDGRILVAGGFDADILAGWLDQEDPDADGRGGVAMVKVDPGRWRADLYAHVGSTNGRELLGDQAGAWFRRDRPGRPFPLWLVRLLRFSGEGDPGYEEMWHRPDEQIRSGEIPVDLQTRGFVGFLLHLHKEKAKSDAPQNGDWFLLDTGARTPSRCPAGLPSTVEDPGLAALVREIREEKPPAPALPMATEPMDVLGKWQGPPLAKLDGAVEVPLDRLVDAYLLPSLLKLANLAFELRVRNAQGWSAPPATPDWVAVPHDGGHRAGPPPNWGGWQMLDAAARAGRNLASLPRGARLELATRDLEKKNSTMGRLWLAGDVQDGTWRITEASVPVPAGTLAEALGFIREMREAGRISVRDEPERKRLASDLKKMELFVDRKNPPSWQGHTLLMESEDIRSRYMLAESLFRKRYGAALREG